MLNSFFSKSKSSKDASASSSTFTQKEVNSIVSKYTKNVESGAMMNSTASVKSEGPRNEDLEPIEKEKILITVRVSSADRKSPLIVSPPENVTITKTSFGSNTGKINDD